MDSMPQGFPMGDMSNQGRTPPVGPIPFEAPVPRTSRNIDQVLLAKIRARRQFFALARDKTATIIPKNGAPYSYRFTSLESVLSMVDEPLMDAGLDVVHLPVWNSPTGSFLISRLIHAESEQWIECVLPIVFDDKKPGLPPQYGAALTYFRRYATTCLLNLASEDDMDAAALTGTGFSGAGPTANPESAERELGRQLNTAFRKLIHIANHASGPAAVRDILKLWRENWLALSTMRGKPAAEGDWTMAVSMVADTLNRFYGPALAKLWRDCLAMATREQGEEAQAAWKTPEVLAERKALQEADDISFRMLREFVFAQFTQLSERLAQQDAPMGLQAAAPASPESAPSPTPASAAEHLLLDEGGELMGEPISDPVLFAKLYGQLAAQSDTDPQELERRNVAALAWCRGFPEAYAMLDAWNVIGRKANETEQGTPAAQPTPSPEPPPAPVESTPPAEVQAPSPAPDPAPSPAPEPSPDPAPAAAAPVASAEPTQLELVPPATAPVLQQPASASVIRMPKHRIPLGLNRSQNPDYMGYIAAVDKALRKVEAEDLEAWIADNATVYNGTPEASKLKVQGLVSRRALQLGVDLKAMGRA